MKKKNFAIGFLIVGVLLLVSAVSYFMVFQETLGNSPTLAGCNTILQDKCVSGYACTSCAKVTLPYYLEFSSGSTNIVYTADCVYGSSNTGGGHTACSSSTNIVSHVKSHCYGNDVYWFNSLNQRETVKTSCSYRCEDYTLDSARCVSAPSCSAQGQSCGSSSLPSCCSGLSCQNFGCQPIAPTGCTDSCTPNGHSECTSDTAFRTCILTDINGCLHWDSGKLCANGQSCNPSTSKCEVKVVVPAVVNKTCSVSSKCINANQYQVTLGNCSIKTVSCGDSEQCSGNGLCGALVVPPVVPSCDGVSCDSYCASDFTSYTQGSCREGVCTYGSVVSMSKDCLPLPSNCTVDLYGVEPCGSGEQQLVAKCVNGNYNYIVYDANQCVEKTFLEEYGLYLAGGIFLLSVVFFVVVYPKKKGGRK